MYENSLFPGRWRLKYWGGKCHDVCSLPMNPLSGLAHKQCVYIEKATWRWTSKRLAAKKSRWWVHSVHYSSQNIIGFFFSFSVDFYLRKTIIYIFYKKETKLLLGAFHDLMDLVFKRKNSLATMPMCPGGGAHYPTFPSLICPMMLCWGWISWASCRNLQPLQNVCARVYTYCILVKPPIFHIYKGIVQQNPINTATGVLIFPAN